MIKYGIKNKYIHNKKNRDNLNKNHLKLRIIKYR